MTPTNQRYTNPPLFCRPKEHRARTTSNPDIEVFTSFRTKKKRRRVWSRSFFIQPWSQVWVATIDPRFNRINPLIRLLLGFPVLNQHLRLIFRGINGPWWKWKEQRLFHQLLDWIFGYLWGWFDDSLVTCPNWLEIQNFNCLGKAFQKTRSQEFTMFLLQLCASTTPFFMHSCWKKTTAFMLPSPKSDHPPPGSEGGNRLKVWFLHKPPDMIDGVLKAPLPKKRPNQSCFFWKKTNKKQRGQPKKDHTNLRKSSPTWGRKVLTKQICLARYDLTFDLGRKVLRSHQGFWRVVRVYIGKYNSGLMGSNPPKMLNIYP